MDLNEFIGDFTSEEKAAYNKVRRQSFCWDVASYLGWNLETHFVDRIEPKELKTLEERCEPCKVTRYEFEYMVEFIDQHFDVDSTIFSLAALAYSYILEFRNGDFDHGDEEINRRVLERLGVFEEVIELVDELLLLIEDSYCPDEKETSPTYYISGEEQELMEDLLLNNQPSGEDMNFAWHFISNGILKASGKESRCYIRDRFKERGYSHEVYESFLHVLMDTQE